MKLKCAFIMVVLIVGLLAYVSNSKRESTGGVSPTLLRQIDEALARAVSELTNARNKAAEAEARATKAETRVVDLNDQLVRARSELRLVREQLAADNQSSEYQMHNNEPVRYYKVGRLQASH
ncbi:MAG: hypothetical protein WC975_15085 [Phycisphaerae bacterium]